MAKAEYTIKLEVDGGKEAQAVFEKVAKALGQTGNAGKKAGDSLEGAGKDFRKAGDALDDTRKKTKSALTGFQSLAVGVTGVTSAMSLVGTAARGAMAPFNALGEKIEETGRLVSQARLYDVDAGFLSGMTAAASTAGKELDDVLDVLRDVRERAGEALAELRLGNETNTFVAAFAGLDVAKEDIKRFAEDSEYLFSWFYDQVGESMKSGNAEIQFRLQELSSAGYEKIGPVVAAGMAKGITSADEFREAMKNLGVALDTDQAETIARLGGNLNWLQTAFEGVKNQILVGLAPSLERLTDRMLKLVQSFGVGADDNPFKAFGEFLGETIEKVGDHLEDFLANPTDKIRNAATFFGEMVGSAMASGMRSAILNSIQDLLTNSLNKVLEFMGVDPKGLIESRTVPAISPEQWAKQRAGAGSSGSDMGARYNSLGMSNATIEVEKYVETAKVVPNIWGAAVTEIGALIQEQQISNATLVGGLEQANQMLEVELALRNEGIEGIELSNRLQIERIKIERALGREQLLNGKETLRLQEAINANDQAAIAAAQTKRDLLFQQYDETTDRILQETREYQALTRQVDNVTEAQNRARTSAFDFLGVLNSGLNSATSSLGSLIAGLGQLLGIDLSGIANALGGLFGGGGRGGQIGSLVAGGLGLVGQAGGLFSGASNWFGSLFQGNAGANGPQQPGALSFLGDAWSKYGGLAAGAAGLGMGIYGLVSGGGSAGDKAAGSVQLSTEAATTFGEKAAEAFGIELGKVDTSALANQSITYAVPSIIASVLAAVLGGSGAAPGSKLAMAGGLTSSAGAAASTLGFGGIGGILGAGGAVVGAAGGGVVIGGKIGDAIGKGNYGNEAAIGGMIGGGVGGAAGAAATLGAVAALNGTVAAMTAGATVMGPLMAGLAATGVGLIVAAVLAVVFALVGDAIAHTPLLGRQTDDVLRATVLDADNFESLQRFKEETGVGFQNLMTTKKTGLGQGQINAGIGEAGVRSDLAAAGFTPDEIAGIMGTGTGYGYLAGGIPFGGAGGLRDAGGEFGMRRKKDDRGAAMMYEANYIGSEQMRMVYANAVNQYMKTGVMVDPETGEERAYTKEEAMAAADDVVAQHLAELGFDLSGALKAFDDQLFIAQSSFAGITGAGTNENGRNEADLARRMQFANDGTMAQGMIDAANSWDTLFKDTMPAGLTGLDLLLVGMGEAAFQSEEVAKNAVQASIEAGGQAQLLMNETVGTTAKSMAEIAAGAAGELGDLTDEELNSLTEKMNVVVDGVSAASDHAFDAEAAEHFLQSWGKSAAIVADTLPAILMSGEVSEGMENLVDQTANHIGEKLLEATNQGLQNSIESLMSERGGIAGILEPITALLNADMTTEEGRQFVMDSLPAAIERSKESIEQYMPQLEYLTDAYQEVNDEIAVALGMMTEAEALVAKIKRDRGRDSVMGRDYESAKVDNFLIDLFVGRENRAAYKVSLEEMGKEDADAYWGAILAAGGDKEGVDAFLATFQQVVDAQNAAVAIGQSVGQQISSGIQAELVTAFQNNDFANLGENLQDVVKNAVFNGIITALITTGPLAAAIEEFGRGMAYAFALATDPNSEGGSMITPAEMTAIQNYAKTETARILGMSEALGPIFAPVLEQLGITPPSTPGAITPAATPAPITWERQTMLSRDAFISSMGRFGNAELEAWMPEAAANQAGNLTDATWSVAGKLDKLTHVIADQAVEVTVELDGNEIGKATTRRAQIEQKAGL